MNDNKLSPDELGVETAPFRGPAIVTTIADLSRTLGGLGLNPTTAERARAAALDLFVEKRGSFPDDVYRRIDDSVAQFAREADAPFVALMLKERHRIAQAVYGVRQMNMWPVPGKSLDTVLADARTAMAELPYWRDTQRSTLRQAIAAIEQIIANDPA